MRKLGQESWKSSSAGAGPNALSLRHGPGRLQVTELTRAEGEAGQTEKALHAEGPQPKRGGKGGA